MELGKSPIPLYYQVEKELREKIASREIVRQDGSLPSEEQLCRMFQVSLITVRKALSGLVLDGIIYRKSGKGTFVLPERKRPISFHLSGNLEDLLAMGSRTRMKILDQRLIPAPPHVKDRLKLGKHEQVYSFEGLRFMGKEPFSFFHAYVAPSAGRLLTPADFKGRKTIFGLLEGITGTRIMHAEQLITAALVDTKVAEHLKMSVGEPILLMERTYYFQGMRPVELATSYFRPELYQYRIQLNRGNPSMR